MYFLREPPDQPVIYPVNYDTLCAIAARFLEHKATPVGEGWTVVAPSAFHGHTRCIALGHTLRVWQHPRTMDIFGLANGNVHSNSDEYIGAVFNILSYHYLGEQPFEFARRDVLRRDNQPVGTAHIVLVPALTAMAVDAVDRDVINATVVRG